MQAVKAVQAVQFVGLGSTMEQVLTEVGRSRLLGKVSEEDLKTPVTDLKDVASEKYSLPDPEPVVLFVDD